MLRKIKGYVDSELGINISKRSNKEAYTFGRAIFYELCNEYYKTPTQKMAEMVGLKSHAAVLNGINETFPYAMSFPEYKEKYSKLRSLISGKTREPYETIKLLEQEVRMLREEVNRLRELEFTK